MDFNNLLPVCTILCSIILDLVKKHLSQLIHLNGLSPKMIPKYKTNYK